MDIFAIPSRAFHKVADKYEIIFFGEKNLEF
jgi:hypothetical protein